MGIDFAADFDGVFRSDGNAVPVLVVDFDDNTAALAFKQILFLADHLFDFSAQDDKGFVFHLFGLFDSNGSRICRRTVKTTVFDAGFGGCGEKGARGGQRIEQGFVHVASPEIVYQ